MCFPFTTLAMKRMPEIPGMLVVFVPVLHTSLSIALPRQKHYLGDAATKGSDR